VEDPLRIKVRDKIAVQDHAIRSLEAELNKARAAREAYVIVLDEMDRIERAKAPHPGGTSREESNP
jgi:hypothetical protein